MKDQIFKDGTSYIKLIENIDAPMLVLKDVVGQNSTPNKFFCIRHDLDEWRQFDYALSVAKLEYEKNYRTTYSVRYISEQPGYNFFSERVVDGCKTLAGSGHELNLHLDVIKLYMNTKESIRNIIEKPLSFLRSKGLEIKGVSAHGSPENYKHGFNYEFWKEFDPKKNEGLEKLSFDKVSLDEFDLSYEAYFLDYDVYLTDSMGKWTGILLNE
jgi:hypothetical protein